METNTEVKNSEKCDYGIKISNELDLKSVIDKKKFYDYRNGDLYFENININEDNYSKLIIINEGMSPLNIYFNNCKFNNNLENFLETVPSYIKSITVTNCKLNYNEAKSILEKFKYTETEDISLSIKT